MAYFAIPKVNVHFENFLNLLLGLSQLSPSMISKKALSRLVYKGSRADGGGTCGPGPMGPMVQAPPSSHPSAPASHHPAFRMALPPPIHQTLPRDSSLLQCLIGHTFLVFFECFLSSHNVNYCGICPGLSPATFLWEY